MTSKQQSEHFLKKEPVDEDDTLLMGQLTHQLGVRNSSMNQSYNLNNMNTSSSPNSNIQQQKKLARADSSDYSLADNTKSINNASIKRKSDSSVKTSKGSTKKRKKSTTTTTTNDSTNDDNNNKSNSNDNDSNNKNNKNQNNNGGASSNSGSHPTAGHRPVTSCTHCRQHKIKCNASEKFPDPCSRCQRMNLKCEIDPQFRPKKGSQIQSLRNDVDELRSKIEFLTRNESLITKVLQRTNSTQLQPIKENSDTDYSIDRVSSNESKSPSLIAKTHLKKEPVLLSLDGRSNSTTLLNDSASNKADLNPALEAAVRNATESPAQFGSLSNQGDSKSTDGKQRGTQLTTPVNTKSISQNTLSPNTQISEFILGDVKITIEKAQTLHKRFVTSYLPYLPIMVSNDPVELYQQSQLLFWTVMLTACLSDPEPNLYNSFASLIKQLAIETCWIRTPRSTHIVQSLLILGTWPLPNQKVLDDCSYRFIGLAKSLSLQLGLHRGKFMTEFSRTQVALPDAEKWRSRTWLAVFFCEQFWSSNLGLPPSLQTDYLLESARIDSSLPKNFRCLISLAIFQAKLVNVMGLNVSSPDGLMEPANRAGPLHIMERELERLVFKLQIDDLVVEIYYLYVKLMVCLFSFLPETPSEDQTKYVTIAYLSATRIVTIMSKLLEEKQLTEYPIYVRHSVTTAAFVLFRLHLTPYLLPKYIDSSRQSIVTVHRLFRNMLAAWKDVENDISRTATVLEKLNFVIITHPELFTDTEGIIVRMRSHLTGSLFYDLVWNIHEARRRTIDEAKNNANKPSSSKSKNAGNKRKPPPLPFYNQITKDDFTAITTTTPNGTTITTLVPTDQAISNAKASAYKAGLSKPTEINGIPLAMLEATGSLSSRQNLSNNSNPFTLKSQSSSQVANSNVPSTKSNTRNIITNRTQTTKKRKSSIKRGAFEASAEPPQNANYEHVGVPKAKSASTYEDTGVKLQRSTSMSAAANGLVPPPLFPSSLKPSANTADANVIDTVDPINGENGGDFSSGFKSMQGNNGSNMSPLQTTLDSKQSMGLTPVSISGLEKFFESPKMSNQSSPADHGDSEQQDSQKTNVQGYGGTSRNSGSSKNPGSNTAGSTSQSPTDSDLLNEMFIDSIFQQNLSKPAEDDDLLGWFDMNMAPEF